MLEDFLIPEEQRVIYFSKASPSYGGTYSPSFSNHTPFNAGNLQPSSLSQEHYWLVIAELVEKRMGVRKSCEKAEVELHMPLEAFCRLCGNPRDSGDQGACAKLAPFTKKTIAPVRAVGFERVCPSYSTRKWLKAPCLFRLIRDRIASCFGAGKGEGYRTIFRRFCTATKPL